ncbi:MAG: exodeoxyribonuclease V subunit gamma [Xanthomonadales bacterium]|nr:exodeoxyribonuclease V subunit gamma [Xanthomonadales bacterium]
MQAAQFIHGNRLEILADRLIDDLQAQAAGDPLQPLVVVVAHPALGRWLQERIARRRGIAINIQFPLPSTFVWQVLRRFSGKLPRESAFSREALVWRIHAALPALAEGTHFERVRHYLGDPSDQRQRYELAVVIARLFDEYTMARPQWIRDWKHGRLEFDDVDERWQAELMRHLAQSVDELDRASLMRKVLGEIAQAPDLPRGLEAGFSIFGAAHLPPLLLEFFLALAQRVPLRFYQPNPCLDYWGDIVSDRERARRRQLWAAHGRRDEEAYLETGHPLLASWGGLGREFLKAIHAPDLVVHDDDAFAAPVSTGLLGWLQAGILLLDPQHAPPPALERVPSLQLHQCASRRREVEVLRDELLRLFDTLDGLLPHEIVVMSPRIEDYVPYIGAVFGDDDALAIPYAISDVPLRATHPLIDAFARILTLGESRIAVSEILGLLAEPAIARRYGLDGEAQDWLRIWIADSGIRWGLDAAFRAELGAAAIDETTWRFGFNRLLLGYASGDDATMCADVVPAINVEGSSAQWLGQFARFVDAIAATRSGFTRPRSADDWKTWLIERLEALLDSETTDPAELGAIRDLREAIAAFGNDAARWLGDEPIAFDVVRSALDAAIAEPRAARAGRFGITFCGMVPMRNVPHRVVCVLGLDAGEFPRRQPPAGFNLMRKHPRPGDRTIREDDRFLFLESLIAAREVFYLSHVDRDAKAGAGNPPSPLVEELTGFLAAAYGEDAWEIVQPAIVRQHPMHAFAPECFRADSAAPSYDRRWWRAAQKLIDGWVDPAPFVTGFDASPIAPSAVDSATGWSEVSIDELLIWLGHPARAFFRQQLPLHLHEAEQDEDVEAFTLDGLSRYQLADRLLGPPSSRPDLKRLQREGAFPLGVVGQQAWDTLTAQVESLEQAAIDLLGGAFQPVAVEATAIEFADLRVRVSGAIRHLVHTVEGSRVLLLSRPGRIRGIDLARLALEHALLGGDQDDPRMFAIGLEKGEIKRIALKPATAMLDWICNLVAWRTRGLQRPLTAFRNSAEAFAASMQRYGVAEKAREAARKVWSDGDFPENADPHHELLARHHGDAVLDESFESFATDVFLPLFEAVGEIRR